MAQALILPHCPPDQTSRAVDLFWQAFGPKFGHVLGPDARAKAFLADVIDPNHCIAALDETGTLIGIAGFKSHDGSFVDGTFADLTRHYGFFGGLWRALLLDALERKMSDGTFLMDGLAVAPEARGKGIGTQLLDAIIARARRDHCQQVRLDVIDTNPRARALYLRHGFAAAGMVSLGPLKHVFGFSQAQTLTYALADKA